MKAIPWEDSFTSQQQSLIIGSLLGDARLESRSKQGTARFRIHHADRQNDLLFWKYEIMKPWVQRMPWKTAWIDKRNGQTYTSWFFHTVTSPAFTPWWKLFYHEGVKCVPHSLATILDPLALATWFMDDGCFQEQSIILNTQSFSKDEHLFLQHVFRENYGIHTSIQHDRSNFRLYFGKQQKKQIESLIRPFLLFTFYKTIPVTTSFTPVNEIAGAQKLG